MHPLPPHRARMQAAASRLLRAEVRLAITGATGWLGQALAGLAHRAGLSNGNGRLRLFGSRDQVLTMDDGSLTPVEALEDARPLDGRGWVIAHFAGLGKERTRELERAEFLEANARILDLALQLAAGGEARAFIYSSSGAASLAERGEVARALDPYAEMKLQQESSLLTAAPAPRVVVARVFNVGGPYGNKLELYALSSLVWQIAAGSPIRIQAQRPVFRSYVHIEELLVVLLAAATLQRTGVDHFETCGAEIVELGDLARRVSQVLDRPDLHIHRLLEPEAVADRYVGDRNRYAERLARAGLRGIGLDDVIRDTAQDLLLTR